MACGADASAVVVKEERDHAWRMVQTTMQVMVHENPGLQPDSTEFRKPALVYISRDRAGRRVYTLRGGATGRWCPQGCHPDVDNAPGGPAWHVTFDDVVLDCDACHVEGHYLGGFLASHHHLFPNAGVGLELLREASHTCCPNVPVAFGRGVTPRYAGCVEVRSNGRRGRVQHGVAFLSGVHHLPYPMQAKGGFHDSPAASWYIIGGMVIVECTKCDRSITLRRDTSGKEHAERMAKLHEQLERAEQGRHALEQRTRLTRMIAGHVMGCDLPPAAAVDAPRAAAGMTAAERRRRSHRPTPVESLYPNEHMFHLLQCAARSS
eukprot:gene38412-8394_t